MRVPSTLDPDGQLDSTIGMLYLGVVLSAMLYGICVLQSFFYFQKYKKDSWYLKAAVTTLIFLDTIQLSMIIAVVYHYTITNYHNKGALVKLYWPFSFEVVFISLNGAIVQGFYTYRVWILSKRNWYVCSAIILLILAELATVLAKSIMSLRNETFTEIMDFGFLTIAFHASTCVTDVVIAGSLCVSLHQARTGFKQTDSLINKLIIFVINTGLLTTLCAIGSFASILLSRSSLIYALFCFSLGRLYTNSFLATLNARKSIGNHEVDGAELNRHSNTSQSRLKAKSISIRVDTIQVLDTEKSVGSATTGCDSHHDIEPQ